MKQLFCPNYVEYSMKYWHVPLCIAALSATLGYTFALAQPPVDPATAGAASAAVSPVAANLSSSLLEWTPPALAGLSSQSLAKEHFTLDRTLLAATAGILPEADADIKHAVASLDGVSVHMLRFAAATMAAPDQIDAIRQAYHLRGFKHVIAASTANPETNGSTDLWLVLDGVNVRGAVVLVTTPKSLTLATLAGNISTVDLLRLRGHFGIPRFDSDGFGGAAH
jgi:hypothetical protein